MYNEEKHDVTFSDLHRIALPIEHDVLVREMPFSHKLKNTLIRNNIISLSDILKTNVSKIAKLRNIGIQSIKIINGFVEDFISKKIEWPNYCKQNEECEKKKKWPELVIKDILNGKTNPLTEITSTEALFVKRCKEGIDILGIELANSCYNNPNLFMPFVNSLNEFVCKTEQELEMERSISACLRSVPVGRLKQRAMGYIDAYTDDDNIKSRLYDIFSCKKSLEVKLGEFSLDKVYNSKESFNTLLSFLSWCSFDIEKEIDIFFKEVYSKNNKDDNIEFVFKRRAAGETLQKIGETINITRERVRQLEAKVERDFSLWNQRSDIMMKISALLNSQSIIKTKYLKKYFGNHYNEMFYLLRFNNSSFEYSMKLDAFVYRNNSQVLVAYELVKSLPLAFTDEEYNEYCCLLQEYDIPLEIFESVFCSEYKKDGRTYHRNKLTLTEVYIQIMNRYFSQGLCIYKETDMNKFRRVAYEEYGCDKLPENDKAIYARIQTLCLMCNRGVYKPKSDFYMSEELSFKIHNYLNEIDSIKISAQEAFLQFEKELSEFGIDNKYHLLAVLREIYGNEYVFRKDYIIKK